MQHPPPNRRFEESLDPNDDGSSLVLRFGTVIAGGIATAILSSLPAAMRMGDGGSAAKALQQWLALAAVLLPLAILTVGVLRRARAGLQILVGVQTEGGGMRMDRVLLLAAGLLWWAVLQLGFLSIFGAVLRKNTHHHGLAGVTFAFVAVVTGVGVAFFAVRGVRMLGRFGSGTQRAGTIVSGLCAFIAILLVGLRTSRAEGLHTAAAMVDVLAITITAVMTSSRLFSRFRPLAIASVPLTVIVILVGLTTLWGDAPLRAAFANFAPVHAFLLGIVS